MVTPLPKSEKEKRETRPPRTLEKDEDDVYKFPHFGEEEAVEDLIEAGIRGKGAAVPWRR